MSPLTAIAIPAATAAATQLVREVVAQRPFASFLGGASETSPSASPANLGELLQQLCSAVAERLAAAGLDPAAASDLSVDDAGEIAVGDHPQRERIEAVLAGDGRIRELLDEIGWLQRQLDFARRYAAGLWGA